MVWMYFGMIGGFLFILIQLVLIVDFAHSWAEAWVGNFEETESRGWYCGLIGVTLLNYALSITGIVLLYVFFTKVCIIDELKSKKCLTHVFYRVLVVI